MGQFPTVKVSMKRPVTYYYNFVLADLLTLRRITNRSSQFPGASSRLWFEIQRFIGQHDV